MNTKNDVEVVINGKKYTLSGYESCEYLQKIAMHINSKYAEFKLQSWYNRLDADMKNILLAINLSDDYYKAQELTESFIKKNEDMEKEIFDIKHEMITMKTQIEAYEKEIKELKKVKREAEMNIVRLETELDSRAVSTSGDINVYDNINK